MADISPGTASPEYILGAARAYVAAGLCVVPIRADGSKAPAVAWNAYEKRLPIDFEIHKWFSTDKPIGLAIIGGSISGNLEIIDFDDPALIQPWIDAVAAILPNLIARLVRISTPKGGAHFYYRAPSVEHNQKLAVAEDKHVLIETRGEGGYVLAPPSHPECHPLKKAYVHADGPLLTEIQTITADERTTLLDTAR